MASDQEDLVRVRGDDSPEGAAPAGAGVRLTKKQYWDQYYAKNKETYVLRARAWRANNKRQHHGQTLKSKYGITIDQYEALLAQQGGVCAICCQPEKRAKQGVVYRLHVDHDHRTGRIRALLCHNCNCAIGHVKEDPVVLERMIRYLESV